MSSEGPSKILNPEEAYCPATAANPVAAQLFEITPWLCKYLLRKGFAVEPFGRQGLRRARDGPNAPGEKEKLSQSVLLLLQSVNDQ